MNRVEFLEGGGGDGAGTFNCCTEVFQIGRQVPSRVPKLDERAFFFLRISLVS